MFAPAIVTLDRNRTKRDAAGIVEHAGRKSGQMAGSYIADWIAQGRALMLCVGGCARKFNAKAAQYGTRGNMPLAAGRCDGCGQMHAQNRLFVPLDRTFL